jgi:hypothetical protein
MLVVAKPQQGASLITTEDFITELFYRVDEAMSIPCAKGVAPSRWARKASRIILLLYHALPALHKQTWDQSTILAGRGQGVTQEAEVRSPCFRSETWLPHRCNRGMLT